MPDSPVLQLQEAILDPASRASDLLRKAYLLASKLEVADLKNWLDDELNGYPEDRKIPDYRRIRGRMKALDQNFGWQPVIFPDSAMQNKFQEKTILQSIPELEALAEHGDEEFQIPLPDDTSKLFGYQTKVKIDISAAQIINIIELVKNIVLEWCLKLEKDGILGQGLDLSAEEKHTAFLQRYLVKNFKEEAEKGRGKRQNASEITRFHTRKHIDVKKTGRLAQLIRNNLDKIGIDEEKRTKITWELKKIDYELKAKEPEAKIVIAAMKALGAVLENEPTNLMACGLLYHIQMIFPKRLV